MAGQDEPGAGAEKRRSGGKKKKTPWIVILGAGFGGLTVATQLDEYLERQKDHDALQVVLVDRNHSLIIGVTHQFALAGRSRPEQVTTSYADLKLRHVFFVQDEILSINTDTGTVLGRGHKFRYQKLVIALGSELDYIKVSGLNRAAYNIANMVHAMQLKDALADFKGGNILITAAGPGLANPTSVYEYALLLKATVMQKGDEKVLKNTRVIVTSCEAYAWPPENSEAMQTLLESAGVEFFPNYTPLHCDVQRRVMVFKNGETIKYDVLVAQFPHKPTDLLVESKLCTENSFIKTNPHTMKTDVPNVYCIGDSADMKVDDVHSIPKCNAFSQLTADVVAADIIRAIEDDDNNWNPSRGVKMQDRAELIAEVGNNKAVKIQVDMYSPGGPSFTVSEPSKNHMRDLISWWDVTVATWFEHAE